MSSDIWNFRGLSRNTFLEHVTPHKICIVILIQEYCILRASSRQSQQLKRVLFQHDFEPKLRKDFCMLVLRLILSPDTDSYEEFLKVLKSDYALIPELIPNFQQEVSNLMRRDVGCIMDVLTNIEKLLIEPTIFEPMINKSSKIGLFLRRVRLFFDKLSFTQTVGIYETFQNFVECKKSSSQIETSKPKVLNTSMPECRDEDMSSCMDIELSSIHGEIERSLDFDINLEKSKNSEGLVGMWSRRQAELFIAKQAKLLVENPHAALPPQQLQEKIFDVLSTNPEHAEAHYLSYLNCLRIKEFNGALDSLFHYFDRKMQSSYEDEASRCKGLRYAALNLAILHASFNHKEEALCALKEAITLSHEANDNVCLQYAQAWLFKLTSTNKDVLIDRSIAKCNELNLNYLSSFSMLSHAKYAALAGSLPPYHVFESVSRSDVLNCQYSMTDMLVNSFSLKSALWCLYGRNELSALVAQQLLHLNTSEHIQGMSSFTGGDAIILAISTVANYFTIQGEYQLAWTVVNHGKTRVPESIWWLLSENILYFTESLHKGLWHHAETAVKHIATVDKHESLLRQSELSLVRGDSSSALKAASEVMETVDCPVKKVRACILCAKSNPKASSHLFSKAQELAEQLKIDYWLAVARMEQANHLFEIGMVTQAYKVLQKAILVIMSNGCYSHMADTLYLNIKCSIASAKDSRARSQMIIQCIEVLTKAYEFARQIEDKSRIKKILYLQALLCNEANMIAERNKFAFEFRAIEEEFLSNEVTSH